MSYLNTQLSPELYEQAKRLADVARSHGLDFFDTIFEMVDYKQLNEIAAYGGYPTRYPHWRFGMEYERLAKSYTYGLSIIYEMVINNDPCYAYLLRANSMVYQKTVIAHVYGHCDFFKNNYWFSKTNRKMLDQMANHATLVRRLIEDVGHDEVEDFIDVCLSLENLIDIFMPFNQPKKAAPVGSEEAEESFRAPPPGKIRAKNYMDKYINPESFIEAQKKKQKEDQEKERSFPEHPERDVLLFLIKHAPISSWERRIIEIVRDESYYFAPQGQTKILNEGWATYWHSLMMTKLAPLSDAEIVDYCDHYAGVVASHPNQLNPYKLGVELLRSVKKRWDRGQFGLDYLNCDDPKKRAEWDLGAGLGNQKLFEVRKIHNDISFIDAYLDEDFCYENNFFVFDQDKRKQSYEIVSKEFPKIKSTLLKQLTNLGNPIIVVKDGNFRNRSELLLKHEHEGDDLKHEYTLECLRNLYKIWRRPVHIETIFERVPRRVSFDGSGHSIDKI